MCNRARIIKAALSGPIPKAPGSAGGYLHSISAIRLARSRKPPLQDSREPPARWFHHRPTSASTGGRMHMLFDRAGRGALTSGDRTGLIMLTAITAIFIVL